MCSGIKKTAAKITFLVAIFKAADVKNAIWRAARGLEKVMIMMMHRRNWIAFVGLILKCFEKKQYADYLKRPGSFFKNKF